MSIRSVFLAFAALLVATPATLRAQEEDIDFPKARREFVAGQPRAAANTLIMASLGVRTQVGRCRDEVVGTDLLNAESSLEKTAEQLRAGSVKSVKTLDELFAKIDRELAHHHLLLVKAVLVRPRADNIPTAARDLDRLAYHFERSFTYAGQKPTAEQAQAIADAQKMSKEIEATNAMPATANATMTLIEKQIVAAEPAATP